MGLMHRCRHILQVYEGDQTLLDALEDFVAAGIANDEAVITIATQSHREALAARLEAAGHDLAELEAAGRFLALSAQQTLDRFMVRGHPDEALFAATLKPIVTRARGDGRPVRAFGEMVALLWSRGSHDATLELERMWNRFMATENLQLFCAYPRLGFSPTVSTHVNAIRAAHSHVLEG
jgi:hypothetical protein